MHRNLICASESHYLSFNFGFCLDMKKLVLCGRGGGFVGLGGGED